MKWSSSRDASDRAGGGISRATLRKADDNHFMQEIQFDGYEGEQQDGIEHAHPYGFTAVPNAIVQGAKAAAEAFVGFLSGNRSHGVAFIVADRRFRLFGLGEGEVALHDDKGHQIHFKSDGMWVSAPKSKKVTIQIMQSDGTPSPPPTSPASGDQMGQGQQATKTALGTWTMDKDGVTLNHPGQFTATFGGDVTWTASSFKIVSDLNVTKEMTAGYDTKDQIGLQSHRHQDSGGIGLDGPPQPGT